MQPLTWWESAADQFTQRAVVDKVDVFAAIGYRPSERQAEFHAATEWDVVYGGAAGGGKTAALVADDLRDAIRYPGIRIGCFRRTYDELEESVLAQLHRFDYPAIGARYVGGSQRELRFSNGSLVRFRYAEKVQDATRRQGGEYQKITIDERTLMPPDVVSVLGERLRTANPAVPVIGMRSGTNPGGVGHAHVRQIVEASDYGKQVWTDEFGHTHRFVPAKSTDNPHLDVAYQTVLDAIPDPNRRAAMRDGSWDSFAGQFFEEWRRDRHVIRPFRVPLDWRHLAGVDYGFANPWAVVWLAVDPDGRVWVYREMYRRRVIEREQARAIAEVETATGEQVVHHADPAMWSKTGEAPSPAEAYTAAQLRMVKAINERIAGWQRVHTFLADGPACAHHRAQGLDECPMLHVFDTCTDLIRTLPSLVHDDDRPEDVDTDGEDHAPDALRYALMALPNPVRQAPTLPRPYRRRRDHLAPLDPPTGDLLAANF